MNSYEWILAALAFVTVFVAVLGGVALLMRGNDARLRERVLRVSGASDTDEPVSMLREQYLQDLTPLEHWLESLPGMRHIERLCEQSGRRVPAYQVVALSLALSCGAALLVAALGRGGLAPLIFLLVLPLPYAKLVRDRNARIDKFEEDLPDALDVMSRALRAGNPFAETLKVVAQEMSDPVATEFGVIFSDINYGVNVKSAFLAALERVPNISLAALVTAVLVQRDTGGNLAEILDRVAQNLRQRHRFKRRLRTLTAEGRMSAWVLVLMPFVLAGVLAISTPSYLPMLIEDTVGLKLIAVALVAMGLGVIWIRRVIRIRY